MAATDDEQETQPRLVLHRQVGKEFTVIFRVEVATHENIGEDSSEILRDNGFRPIYMILGAVCEGSLSKGEVQITSENFQQIHSRTREKYTIFWNQGNTKVFLSNRLPSEFNQGNPDETLEVETLPTYNIPNPPKPLPLISRPRPPIDNIAKLILLAILTTGFLLSSSVLSKFFF